jgi:hypothetical protein
VNATGTNPSVGTSVSTWFDKSGKGRNCTWFSPTILVNSNGINSLYINSNTPSSNVGTIPSPIGTFSNYFSAFIVQKGYDQIINRGNPATYAAPLYMSGNARYVGWGPGNNRAQVTGTFQSLDTLTASGPGMSEILLSYPGATSNALSNGGPYYVSGPTGANMGTYAEYFNGVPYTVTNGPFSMDDNGNYPVFLLQGNGSETQKSLQKGNYYEVILFSINIPTAQRQAMEGYFAWKWNMVSSLPAGHPYLHHGVPIISLPPPTSVKMVALATAQTSVTVNWVASTMPNSSYTVVFYQVSTRTTSGGTILQTLTGVTGTTASSTQPLTGGQFYYATVTAVGTTVAGAVTSPSVASTGAVLALSPTGTFNPLAIPDIQLWLDANDVAGNGSITPVNTPITLWLDKSTYGRNCTFTTSTRYLTGNLIGVNQSGGTNTGTIAVPVGTFASYYNVFVVQKGYDQPIARTDPGGWPGPIDVGGPARHVGPVNTPSQTRTQITASPIPNMATVTATSSAIWQCSLSYPNGMTSATGTWTEYVNGTQQGSQGSLKIGDAYGFMYLMTRGGTGGTTGAGTYSEIIAFSGPLTTNQRQIVEGYLAWKWSLQSTLPADHPYKTVAPTASATQ